jgi:hypothetical protein
MNTKIVITFVITLIIIAIIIYKFKGKITGENFRNLFVKNQTEKITDYIKSGVLVSFIEEKSNLALEYNYRTGFLKLKKINPNNPYQYWIYYPDGIIQQPTTKLCLDYFGLDFPPSITICSKKAGHKFIFQEDGTITNKAKRGLYLSSISTAANNIRVPIIGYNSSRWKVVKMCESNYYNALSSAFLNTN